jgi:glycosyltransferase involved in cell wall biosynthesis
MQILDETRFVIMTCVYNAEKWIGKCINSVVNQMYDNYIQIVVDDASTDNTWYEIDVHAKHYPDKVYTYRNDKNVKWIQNAINHLDNHILNDEDVIVILDGDDWLAHNEVLARVAMVYQQSDTWMTYSLFAYPDGGTSEWIPRYTTQTLKNRDFRNAVWSFTHLRAFKAFLWNNLDRDDLRGPDGNYTPYTYDQALLFPMLEMCPYGRVKFLNDVMYVYNTDNPLQVEKYDKTKQQALGRWFRSKQKYEILERQ